jgi:choice-of-anchor A domain-containing protein
MIVLLPRTAQPAALVAQSISFGSTVTFDSFDSGDANYNTGGQYDAAKSKDNGDVLCGAGFMIGGHSWVMGHVKTAPGFSVVAAQASSIGSKSWVRAWTRGIQPGWFTNDLSLVLPDLILPPIPWAPAAPGSYTVDGTTYAYAFLTNGSYSVASLAGKVYVGTNAHVQLLITNTSDVSGIDLAPQGAGLVVYMAGASLSLSGPVNNTNSPKTANLLLFGLPTCASINIAPAGYFVGTLYAPEADLQIGTPVFIGSSLSKSVYASQSLAFHYDEQPSFLPTWFGIQPESETVLAGHDARFMVGGALPAQFVPEPTSFQWRFNGSPIPNATNSSLTLSNVSLQCAGAYSVIISNAWGSQTSPDAILSVVAPVCILGQPVSQASLAGSNAVLRVTATGSEPLAYCEPSLTFGSIRVTNAMTFVAKYDSAGNALWGGVPIGHQLGPSLRNSCHRPRQRLCGRRFQRLNNFPFRPHRSFLSLLRPLHSVEQCRLTG